MDCNRLGSLGRDVDSLGHILLQRNSWEDNMIMLMSRSMRAWRDQLARLQLRSLGTATRYFTLASSSLETKHLYLLSKPMSV